MNPQQKSIVMGAMIGAVLGALGGFLFTRGIKQTPQGQQAQGSLPRPIPAGEVVKLVISILAVLRGVAELGEKG